MSACGLLFYLVSNLIIGYAFYKSNKKHSFENWYSHEFRNYKFRGKVKDFFRKDSIECWLVYSTEISNEVETKDSENSFDLAVVNKDSILFNRSLIDKVIEKDSGSVSVKIYIDNTNTVSTKLPFYDYYKEHKNSLR